ncbi:MAG TPA: hypothetical protein VFF08_02150 [Trueperaceae bacterium]|nr:hypothetical protein [Trueperaceae bacterium]
MRERTLPRATALGLATALALALTASASAQDLTAQPPPEPWVNVATILELPEFVPGAGALYVDPANAPVGPWLAYGTDGSLVEVLFMVPVSEMRNGVNWDDLAGGLLAQLGLTVDHVDVTFNGGHPGMAEPHYHVRLAFVDHATQTSLLTQ